jgi:hypothetical protein
MKNDFQQSYKAAQEKIKQLFNYYIQLRKGLLCYQELFMRIQQNGIYLIFVTLQKTSDFHLSQYKKTVETIKSITQGEVDSFVSEFQKMNDSKCLKDNFYKECQSVCYFFEQNKDVKLLLLQVSLRIKEYIMDDKVFLWSKRNSISRIYKLSFINIIDPNPLNVKDFEIIAVKRMVEEKLDFKLLNLFLDCFDLYQQSNEGKEDNSDLKNMFSFFNDKRNKDDVMKFLEQIEKKREDAINDIKEDLMIKSQEKKDLEDMYKKLKQQRPVFIQKSTNYLLNEDVDIKPCIDFLNKAKKWKEEFKQKFGEKAYLPDLSIVSKKSYFSDYLYYDFFDTKCTDINDLLEKYKSNFELSVESQNILKEKDYDKEVNPRISNEHNKIVHYSQPEKEYSLYAAPLGGKITIESDDVKQGILADCYLLATLGSIAKQRPEIITNAIKEKSKSEYHVRLFVPQVEGDKIIRKEKIFSINTDVVFERNKHSPAYAGFGDGELWVIILEKAFAKARGGFKMIEGGNSTDVIAMLTNEDAQKVFLKSKDDSLLQQLDQHFRAKRIVVFESRSPEYMPLNSLFITSEKLGVNKIVSISHFEIECSHAYTLDAVNLDTQTIDLLNPRAESHLKEFPVSLIYDCFNDFILL